MKLKSKKDDNVLQMKDLFWVNRYATSGMHSDSDMQKKVVIQEL
jgi:hypothetical protein